MELASQENSNSLTLDHMLKGIVPYSSHLKAKRHTAGGDAHLHVLVYRALVQLAKESLNKC